MCHHMLRLRGVFMVYGFGEKKFMVYGFRGNFLWFMVSHTPPKPPSFMVRIYTINTIERKKNQLLYLWTDFNV